MHKMYCITKQICDAYLHLSLELWDNIERKSVKPTKQLLGLTCAKPLEQKKSLLSLAEMNKNI